MKSSRILLIFCQFESFEPGLFSSGDIAFPWNQVLLMIPWHFLCDVLQVWHVSDFKLEWRDWFLRKKLIALKTKKSKLFHYFKASFFVHFIFVSSLIAMHLCFCINVPEVIKWLSIIIRIKSAGRKEKIQTLSDGVVFSVIVIRKKPVWNLGSKQLTRDYSVRSSLEV